MTKVVSLRKIVMYNIHLHRFMNKLSTAFSALFILFDFVVVIIIIYFVSFSFFHSILCRMSLDSYIKGEVVIIEFKNVCVLINIRHYTERNNQSTD